MWVCIDGYIRIEDIMRICSEKADKQTESMWIRMIGDNCGQNGMFFSLVGKLRSGDLKLSD